MPTNQNFNIFKNLWFNFVVIPALIFFWTLVGFFAPDFNRTDKVIMTYFSIGLLAFVVQLVLMLKLRMKHHTRHYLYILIALNISLFISYFLNKFILLDDHWWKRWLVNPLIVFVVIFSIKTIVWYLLAWTYRKKTKQNLKQIKTQDENLVLAQENAELKAQLAALQTKTQNLTTKIKTSEKTDA